MAKFVPKRTGKHAKGHGKPQYNSKRKIARETKKSMEALREQFEIYNKRRNASKPSKSYSQMSHLELYAHLGLAYERVTGRSIFEDFDD